MGTWSSGEMQARGTQAFPPHTCLHCTVDGRDGSPEQQGLLIEVVLVGVSPDASKTLGCLRWFHGSQLAARDQERWAGC